MSTAKGETRSLTQPPTVATAIIAIALTILLLLLGVYGRCIDELQSPFSTCNSSIYQYLLLVQVYVS